MAVSNASKPYILITAPSLTMLEILFQNLFQHVYIVKIDVNKVRYTWSNYPVAAGLVVVHVLGKKRICQTKHLTVPGGYRQRHIRSYQNYHSIHEMEPS